MSKNENEHTSYELSKSLHELGFKGEHKNVYVTNSVWKRDQEIKTLESIRHLPYYEVLFPAYTFSELWAVLPLLLENYFMLGMGKEWDTKTNIQYIDREGDCHTTLGGAEFSHESPAEAAGLMVAWLIENGYLGESNG